MRRFDELFVLLNRWLVALTLGAVFLIVFSNVIGRYGFAVSLPWAEEVARHLMVFGAFAGAGLALREGKLVAIRALVDRLHPGGVMRLIIMWSGIVLMGAFMTLVIWFGVQFVAFGWDKVTMATQVPRGIPYLSIPIGAALFLVHLVLFARRFVEGDFDTTSDGETV